MTHDQQQNTGRVLKGRLHAKTNNLSLVHDVLVLLMISLIANWTRVALNCVTYRFCEGL